MRTSGRTSRSVARPVILVVGATGAQGGGVARQLLANGAFRVRALTRDPSQPAARALLAAGAEVVRGDLADPASLRAALAGAYGVFGVTSWFEHGEREYPLGRNLLGACAASSVAHVVLSAQPSAMRASAGRLRVPMLDIKAQLQEYAWSLGLPTTFVHAALYYESFFFLVPPARQPDGRLALALPLGEKPLAAVAAADVGGVVARLFEIRDAVLGRTIDVAGDQRPVRDYLASVGRALGEPVDYEWVSREAFADRVLPEAEGIGDLFEFYRRHAPCRAGAIAECRALYPAMRTFDEWMVQRGHRYADLIAA